MYELKLYDLEAKSWDCMATSSWKNFICYIDEKGGKPVYGNAFIDKCNKELKVYGAKYYSGQTILFKNEEDFLIFKLRFN